MKRQRGRGRKPGGGGGHHNNYQHHNQPNRTMESNGPEVKVRGPAAHIYERYLQLARDASASGDRVLGENYLQHADHYFRLLRSMQPATPAQPPQGDRFGGAENDMDDEEGRQENEPQELEAVPDNGGQQGDTAAEQQGHERDGDFRRRRGRRNRFRPAGEEGGGEQAQAREFGGEQNDQPREQRAERPPQSERPERRERAPRERTDEPAEGFAVGPKPAFLGSD